MHLQIFKLSCLWRVAAERPAPIVIVNALSNRTHRCEQMVIEVNVPYLVSSWRHGVVILLVSIVHESRDTVVVVVNVGKYVRVGGLLGRNLCGVERLLKGLLLLLVAT